MKFVLVLQVCYLVLETCIPPMNAPDVYDDWFQCKLAGLAYSTDIVNNIGSKLVNQNKVAINFTCINENQTNKTSISSIK